MSNLITVTKQNPATWLKVQAGFYAFKFAMRKHQKQYLRSVGDIAKEFIQENIESGGRLANAPFKANSPVTVAKKGSSKPLIDNGDLKRLISVQIIGSNQIKVGALKKHPAGVDLAAIHEHGARTGRNHSIDIPARPFVGPSAKSPKLRKLLEEEWDEQNRALLEGLFGSL